MFHSKFMNLSSLNRWRIRHIRDLSDIPRVVSRQYFQTNAENVLKMCWNCFAKGLLPSQSIYRSSIPLKHQMFRSEINKDFWCVLLLIYFSRILSRKVKVNRRMKTSSDLKLQIQMMSTKLLFNDAPRKYCGYGWMIHTLFVFSLLCKLAQSLVIESVFECFRLIRFRLIRFRLIRSRLIRSRFTCKSYIFLWKLVRQNLICKFIEKTVIIWQWYFSKHMA
jgi:hypothetical protein